METESCADWWLLTHSSLCSRVTSPDLYQHSQGDLGYQLCCLCRLFDREWLQLIHKRLSRYWCLLWLMFPWNEFRIRVRSTNKIFWKIAPLARVVDTYSFAALFTNNSFVCHITFVAENHPLYILVRMFIYVPQPLDYIFEALLVCYIVN